MDVLGIEVGDELLAAWRRWLAPPVQPFFVTSRRDWPTGMAAGELTPELRDTYRTWKVDRELEVLWLDEEGFNGLERSARARLVRQQVECGRGAVPTVRRWCDLLDGPTLRAQADGHRFVWWPSLVASPSVLRRVIEDDDVAPSRHREARCSGAVLELAGTFAAGSGPNCFGTVLAAAGVAGARDERVVEAPFLEWLGAACRPGGRDHEAGTVLVWRDAERRPVHAAITIGDGWAFEKPSQCWYSPRVVLPVADVLRANRTVGNRLERHRLTSGNLGP